MSEMSDMNAKLLLANLYNISTDYEDLETDCEHDSFLLDVVCEALKLWPNPKLERKWRDYEEYYEACGSDSMLFSELLYATIDHVELSK